MNNDIIDSTATVKDTINELNNISEQDIVNAVNNLSPEQCNEIGNALGNIIDGQKICTVKFTLNGDIGYRFDIYSHPERVDGKRVVEIKNIYNNFNGVIPDAPRELKYFFEFVGVIRYVFPRTIFPIGDDTTEDSLVITLENQINKYIKIGKIKGMEIRIDR
jgi:hypothetical protein